MALPSPTQLEAAVKALLPAHAQQLSILGFNIDASQIEAIVTVAVDAMCMTAWKQAQAAGQMASDNITTAAQAEAELRKP